MGRTCKLMPTTAPQVCTKSGSLETKYFKNEGGTQDFFHSPPHILENVSIWYISYISNLITKTPVTPGDTQYPIMLNVTLSHRSYSLVCEQNDEVVVYPVEQLTFSVKSLCLCDLKIITNYLHSHEHRTEPPPHTHTHLNIS